MKAGVAGLVGLLALSAQAATYNDSTNDIDAGISSGGGTLDIVSMEVTHNATDLMFSLTLNGNITTTDWGNFMIGIATGGSGTTTGNGWVRPINLDSPSGGMDYWIGSWVSLPGPGGSQFWSYDGSSWSNTGALSVVGGSYTMTPGVQSVLAYTVPLSTLGVGNGDTFYFDAYTSGGGGTDSAVDALSNPNVSITSWSQAYTSSTNGGGLSSYTLSAIPEPATMSLIGLGVLGGLGFRRRRR